MPTLYLSPSLLADSPVPYVLPSDVIAILHQLQQFIVEDLRTARRFLSKIKHPTKTDLLQLRVLNEHTPESDTASLLPFLLAGDTAVISDAGAPAIADPGAAAVRLAHINGIKVVPLAGPSSILMALMASGLNGQSFAFTGYLPQKQSERQQRLRALERRSAVERQTQIFIETPYRNMQLLADIMQTCKSSTLLTVAADITGAGEFIMTQTVQQWKQHLPELNRIPAVFLLQAC